MNELLPQIISPLLKQGPMVALLLLVVWRLDAMMRSKEKRDDEREQRQLKREEAQEERLIELHRNSIDVISENSKVIATFNARPRCDNRRTT